MEFAPTVRILRGVAEGNPLREVFELFHSITQMDENQVVAAYQAIYHTAMRSGKTQDPDVQAVLRAIIAQMVSLIHESYSHEKRRKLQFEAVVGFRLTPPDPFENMMRMLDRY